MDATAGLPEDSANQQSEEGTVQRERRGPNRTAVGDRLRVPWLILAAAGAILVACGAPDGELSDQGGSEPERAETDTAAPEPVSGEMAERISRINQEFVFADVHAHPSRFHRADVERITREEVGRYLREEMDVVVASISTDAAYHGGYVERDGDTVSRGEHPRPPREKILGLAEDRLERILASAEDPHVLMAEGPETVQKARSGEDDRLVVIPAFEGGDGLAGEIDQVQRFHDRGVRLLQLVHFRANELGHIQTYPYSPGGLREFGAEVIREANRLDMLLDLAHANTETMREAIEVSEDPMLFSHTGAAAIHKGDRYLEDDEIRMIAEDGGLIGIWPYAPAIPTLDEMADHIDHVVDLVGVEHVAIASDLRGLGAYSKGFGEEARFRNIAATLLERGYSEDEVGQIMGGNFMRLWRQVASE